MNDRAQTAPSLPSKMRVVVCDVDARTRLEARRVPQPGPGEVLLRLEACGLCGTDLHKLSHDSHVGAVLGHEIVGTVVAVGLGGVPFEPGQRIVTPHHVPCGACRWCLTGTPTRCPKFQEEQLAPGGFSEYVLVREPAVRRAARSLPDDLSTEAAVFLEPAACVLRGIDRSGLAVLHEVGFEPVAVILGGGSMGLLHLLVLRCLYPSATVVLSEPLSERRELGRQLGTTLAVAPAELSSAVTDLSPEGADAVFDTVGDPGWLEPGLDLLRDGGAMVLFAHFRQGQAGAVQDRLFRHERRLVGTYSGALAEQARVFAMLEAGELRPESLVTHTLPLTRFDHAVELVASHAALKVLLRPE